MSLKSPIELCNGFEPAGKEGAHVVVTVDETTQLEMEYLGLVKYQAADYGIFFPLDVFDDDSGELVILRLVEGGEEGAPSTFQTLDDIDIVRAVYNVFKEHTASKYDFAD